MEMEMESTDEYGWDYHGFEADRIIQLQKLSELKKYKVSNVKFVDPINPWAADGADELFGDLVGLRPGGIYTKKELAQRLESLWSSHYFERVDLDAQTNHDGTLDIHIPFQEKIYPPKKTFKCLSICGSGCVLPRHVQQRIEGALRHSGGGGLRSSLLRRIVSQVHKWYRDNGYYAAHVVSHGPLESDDNQIIFQVDQGDKEEKAYHNNNICSLYNLFSTLNIIPKSDTDIVLQEHPRKWRLSSTKKNQPGPGSLPTLTCGATVSFERRNVKGPNRSFQGALALSSIFLLEDVHLEYTHPYMDGINDPRNRTFKATCFSTCPVFKCGPRANDKPIRVDRLGIKATITENYTKKSKFTYGVVMEDIRSRDEEDGSIAATGHRLSFNGLQNRNRRPGVDRMATLQANLTRDDTMSVNGAVVGEVDVIQVDQGVGIGTRPAFFNRLQMSAKRFIPLRNVQEGAGAPPVLVLHGAFGNCVGDVPNHEAFAIGGPDSVRGYNVGEIGTSRRKLEVSAEIRVPVKSANLYGFIEHGNDLGGSAGNQTRGHGSSAGVGIQLGPLRAEYVVHDNSGKGSVLFHFGERI